MAATVDIPFSEERLNAETAFLQDAVSLRSERWYSSAPLIRPPYFPGNCGHIREVALVRGKIKCIHSSSRKNLLPQGGL